jgi:hypothetical protein
MHTWGSEHYLIPLTILCGLLYRVYTSVRDWKHVKPDFVDAKLLPVPKNRMERWKILFRHFFRPPDIFRQHSQQDETDTMEESRD